MVEDADRRVVREGVVVLMANEIGVTVRRVAMDTNASPAETATAVLTTLGQCSEFLIDNEEYEWLRTRVGRTVRNLLYKLLGIEYERVH